MVARDHASSVHHPLGWRLGRREFLRGMFGAAGLAAASPLLGACGRGSSAGSAPTAKLEMFSWWTSGGEAAGLKAMYDSYTKAHPGVEIVNQAVAGGAGSNAKAVLKTRLQGG